MDVVPPDSPEFRTTPPFQPDRRNSRLYGRDAADLNSGFAIGMLMLQALRDMAPGRFETRRPGFVAAIEDRLTRLEIAA